MPVVRLTEVIPEGRQKPGHRKCSHRINEGGFPDLRKPGGERDFYLVKANDPEVTVARTAELCALTPACSLTPALTDRSIEHVERQSKHR